MDKAAELRQPSDDDGVNIRTSDHLVRGDLYTRKDLRERFQVNDATLNTGVFRPKGHDSVWLFVTINKQADRTQYEDSLDGDVLSWQGQSKGGTDRLIIEHVENGLELVLFFRVSKTQHPGAGFSYEGTFEYERHAAGGPPTNFTLVRAQRTVKAPARVVEQKPTTASGQGWMQDPEKRKLVEDAAQARLMRHYEVLGWIVEDTRVGNQFDAIASRDGETLYLEAKGTVTVGNSVMVTRNEVAWASDHPGECVLGVLSDIKFDKAGVLDPSVGTFQIFKWEPEDAELNPISFDWKPRPRKRLG